MIEKMIEQQEELEWTNEALRTDARSRIWAKCAMGAAALFLAAVAATTWQYSR
jgi:hypothetical protein